MNKIFAIGFDFVLVAVLVGTFLSPLWTTSNDPTTEGFAARSAAAAQVR